MGRRTGPGRSRATVVLVAMALAAPGVMATPATAGARPAHRARVAAAAHLGRTAGGAAEAAPAALSTPTRVAPADDSLVDPYLPLTLRASKVSGATSYRFSVARVSAPSTEVWGGTGAAPGTEATVTVPRGTFSLGVAYQWSVTALSGGDSSSVGCCGRFVANTGGPSSSSMMTRTTTGRGYWQVGSDGDIASFGDARDSGSASGLITGTSYAVGILAQPRSRTGYWILAETGAIFAFGGAPAVGAANTGLIQPGHRAVGMASTPTGNGYWIATEDGAVFSFGDAVSHGAANTGSIQAPHYVTAMASTPTGGGYWLLTEDGAVFSFGDAVGHGAANTGVLGSDRTSGFQATPTGGGYWMATRTGGEFSFGDAVAHGAANTGVLRSDSVAGFVATPDGGGYWFMSNTFGVFSYGNAQYYGGANVTLTPGQPTAPADASRFFAASPGATPQLAVTAGANGSGALQYDFKVSTQPDVGSEIVDESGWQAGTTYSPKPLNLQDGRTYFWRVWTKDNDNAVPSEVRTFRVERRFGTSQPSPYETVGPVSVNLASGNLVVGWSSPSINGAGLNLGYNALAPVDAPQAGLPPGWSGSWAGDTSAVSLLATTGTVTILMADGSKETFTLIPGGANGDSWRPEDGSDSTLANVDGARWIYASEDGTSYEFEQAGTLLSTTLPVDQRKSSALTYTWVATPVGRRMTTATDPISGRAMRLYFQGDGQNGCTGSAPSGAVAAPNGMLCAVKLMDDSTYRFWYSSAMSGIQEIARVMGSDGTVTKLGWEVASASGLGTYARPTAVTDVLANDAVAAGARTDDATIRTQISYQADGRVQSVTAPAPTVGAARQVTSIAYSGATTTVSKDRDIGPAGYTRQVESDALGRQVAARDSAGRATVTVWRSDAPGDSVARVDAPNGMRTGTDYDDQWRPTDTWGPAPVAWFDAGVKQGSVPTAGNAAATPHQVTAYDEGLTGWSETFYGSTDLSGGVKRRSFQAAPSTFSTGAAGFDGLSADGWSMRAEALATPPVSGQYVFRSSSDGGIRVFVDDRKVIDGWDLGDGSAKPSPGPDVAVALTAGKRVKIRVEYVDRAGDANWSVTWSANSGPNAVIGQVSLQPNFGLVSRTVDPDGDVTKQAYADPAVGLATSSTQVVGGGQADLTSVASYEADGSGWRRQAYRRMPTGVAVSYTYYGDRVGPVANACGVTGANQAGRLKYTTSADPDAFGPQVPIRRWYAYDAAGRTAGILETTTATAEADLAAQPWVCTTYDSRGRPTKVVYPAYGAGAARTVTYDYTNPLRPVATDPAGAITSASDLLGRTTAYTDALGNTTTYTYDLAGRTTSYSLKGSTVSYGYWPDGLLKTVSFNGKVLASASYVAADGRLAGVTYPSGAGNLGNGTTGTFAYDQFVRPAGVAWRGAGNVLLASEDVTRTLAGRLLTQTIDGVDTNGASPDFAYDGAGRLTSATVRRSPTAATTSTYAYAFGDTNTCGAAAAAGKNSNRTTRTVDGVVTRYCYDQADKLTSTVPSMGTIAYDSHGNTTSIFGESHTYDIADRHLSTTRIGTTVAYTRDLTDRIVERKVNGVVVEDYAFTNDSDAPTVTYNVVQKRTDWNLGLPGGVSLTLLTSASANNVWSYPNMEGATLAVAGQGGSKAGSTYLWDPDGNAIAGGIPNTQLGNADYGWKGEAQRLTEHEGSLSPMLEMGARQYSPVLGRFLEVDPIEGGTANDYAYATDPINRADLTGESICIGSVGFGCHRKKDRFDRLTKAQVKHIYESVYGIQIGTLTDKQANALRKALRSSKLVMIVAKANPHSPPGYVAVPIALAKGLWAYYKPGLNSSPAVLKAINAISGRDEQISLCTRISRDEQDILSGYCDG